MREFDAEKAKADMLQTFLASNVNDTIEFVLQKMVNVLDSLRDASEVNHAGGLGR